MSYPLKMINAVVIYHSGYGHTERMAAAVAEGASARLIPIDSEGNIAEEAWERISEADVILLGSPTYRGARLAVQKICRCISHYYPGWMIERQNAERYPEPFTFRAQN